MTQRRIGNRKLSENVFVQSAVDQIGVLEKTDIFLTHWGRNPACEGLNFRPVLEMQPQTSEQKMLANGWLSWVPEHFRRALFWVDAAGRGAGSGGSELPEKRGKSGGELPGLRRRGSGDRLNQGPNCGKSNTMSLMTVEKQLLKLCIMHIFPGGGQNSADCRP